MFIPDPITQGVVHTTAGRSISYAEYGHPEGAPVLFIPGAASGSRMAFGGDALAHERIRLISIDRPGLGRSEPDPEKTFVTVAADLGILVERLAGGPVPVVANSQGAPFGIAVAAAGSATTLVLVSPSDEVAAPDVRAQLPRDLQDLVDSVGTSTMTEATEMFSSFTAQGFFDMVMQEPSETDAAVYATDEFRRRFRAVVEAGFQQGSGGYARDTALAMSRWPIDLAAITVPVRILFGAEDGAHSPDLGVTLAKRFTDASLVVIPGEGGSLLWSRPELVIELCR